MEKQQNSVVADLISDVEAGGEFVDEGGFDIDSVDAFKTLERFQTADPHTYILRFAEAGLIAGATRLRFDVEPGRVRVAFDRPAPIVIPPTVLGRLLTVLVSNVSTATEADQGVPRRALVQLAVGILAALRLGSRAIVIESVGPDGRGFRQVFGEQASAAVLEDARPGMRICVHEASAVGDRMKSVLGQRREHALIAERCGFDQTPVYLDGRPIWGRPLLTKTYFEVDLSLDGKTIGRAGLSDDLQLGYLRVLSRGMLLETQILPSCRSRFSAAIDLPLARDMSKGRVLRSPEFLAALEVVHATHDEIKPLSHVRARARASGRNTDAPFVDRTPRDAGDMVLWMKTVVSLVAVGVFVVAFIALLVGGEVGPRPPEENLLVWAIHTRPSALRSPGSARHARLQFEPDVGNRRDVVGRTRDPFTTGIILDSTIADR